MMPTAWILENIPVNGVVAQKQAKAVHKTVQNGNEQQQKQKKAVNEVANFREARCWAPHEAF